MAAEAIALLCGETLGLPGAEYRRGYLQSWGQGQTFTERYAQRIFRAADPILRAGYPDECGLPNNGGKRSLVAAHCPLPTALSLWVG